MAWDHLSINKPHLAYTILGGFTTIFMLVSLFIKEKLYIGEATVATICGIIFGPSGLGWFNPDSWGNVDQITLEASRIVLVVQCFAVGVELPKKYMTRHWRSVIFLLIPVMTWGWLVTSLFIWWMIEPLSWLESLACAACVTATDPVLASSVVGKGKFARRIPKHLRDLLSAESGCNDGMAFPFIYLALYLIDYRPHAGKVFQHWFCLTVLYECVFGSIYGIIVGYAGRQAIKWAEKKQMIDRESFLVFYFVLALWCAGTGSMLGLDDLLVGFCAGVAFSNDGWFAQKTEESHVSNVIDLLLNLAYFVYFGSIIPWSSYNRPDWGITPWRLVVIAIFVILFRRIPIMVALKPLIPDIKTWREALFAGHFGPIGVGAIFVAIMARAELEHGDTTPLASLPAVGHVNYMVIELIWPITTFIVISSIVVHGSSIAVFTLGKHVNTMRITMSYTTANEEDNWLARLPRLTPRPSMSIRKPDTDDSDEKLGNGQEGLFPPGTLPPPGGIPGGFLARTSVMREDSPAASRPSSIKAKRRKNWENGMGPGGPISDSAIAPRRSTIGSTIATHKSEDVTVPERAARRDNRKDYEDDVGPTDTKESRIETYQEGGTFILENEQGDVVHQTKTPPRSDDEDIGPLDTSNMMDASKNLRNRHAAKNKDKADNTGSSAETSVESSAMAAAAADLDNEGSGKHRRREPAWAYRFDDNVIVEDEDGEVIRRYKLPNNRPESSLASSSKKKWTEWTNIFTRKGKSKHEQDNDDDDAKTVYSMNDDDERKAVHFRMHDEKGRRLSKQEFLHQLQKMDPHARAAMASRSDLPEGTRREIAEALSRSRIGVSSPGDKDFEPDAYARSSGDTSTETEKAQSPIRRTETGNSTDDRDEETPAERKRRQAALGITENDESSENEPREVPARTQSVSPGTMMKSPPGIRFADQTPVGSRPSSSGGGRGFSLSWSEDVKGKSRE